MIHNFGLLEHVAKPKVHLYLSPHPMMQWKLPKIGGSKMAHLRVGPLFSRIFFSGNIFPSFFRQRKIDEESNTSGFIFFKAFLNYL